MKIKNTNDVAIVGMACRFPGAKNYNEYWKNLIENKNSVSEIPRDRWRWEDYYGEAVGDANKTKIKYGGFIDDVDKFDPLFFKISPSEANYIDPQHRIFLEASWHAIEDAGYNPRSLAGKDIGVYAGVSKNDYAELMRELHVPIISFLSTGTVHSILANRVSFLLDLKGKSEVVDTACSSFLVALNNAIRDVRAGVCEAALVGGVNSILSPTMYISHSKSGMLSEDGACKTFDANANGYVRSEGVGVVYIKPLQMAIDAGDNILGVIKGSAVKHGGRSNFLTAPKVSSQAATISAALEDAGVNANTIGYVEAHGTGTPLGDPIEIDALKQAYQPFISDDMNVPFCGLSSVKTNTGHLESAAGVAGLIKVLMSFKHKTIPSLLHFNTLNPYIKLDSSPFYIVGENKPWQQITRENKRVPRRAGVSSFGMGGVNAHVILEEAPSLVRDNPAASTPDIFAIPISAASDEQLQQSLLLLKTRLLDGQDQYAIEDIAYTLQCARDTLAKRIVLLAKNYETLLVLIDKALNNETNENILRSSAKPSKQSKSVDPQADLVTRGQLWVDGAEVEVESLQAGELDNARRIQLPGYPFQRMSCWFPRDAKAQAREQYAALPNYEKHAEFTPAQYFVRDHIVKGETIVPGVKSLEIFRASAQARQAKVVTEIRDVYWMRPIKVADSRTLEIHFEADEPSATANLSLSDGVSQYSAGEVVFGLVNKPKKRLNLDKLRGHCQHSCQQDSLYQLFNDNGLAYGESFQVIQTCYYADDAVLCELQQSPEARKSQLVLEPSILDGVFQSVVALYSLHSQKTLDQKVPFYLKSLKIYAEITPRCFVYVRKTSVSEDGSIATYHMYLCNENGDIILEFEEFTKREYVTTAVNNVHESIEKNEESQLLYYAPKWMSRELGMHCENINALVVFDVDDTLVAGMRELQPNADIILVTEGDTFEKISDHEYSLKANEYASLESLWENLKDDNIAIESIIYRWNFDTCNDIAEGLHRGVKYLVPLTQSLIYAKLEHKIRILYLHPETSTLERCLHSTVGGFSRTLAYENPNIDILSLGIDEQSSANTAQIVSQEHNFYANAALNEIRYINGERQVKAFFPHSRNQNDDVFSLVKEKGVYIITGGAGGLGYIFAMYLAKHYHAKLALLGRSHENSNIKEKLDALNAVGGEAQYYACNVTDNDALAAVCDQVRTQYLNINGVLHCAGLIEDAYIIKKTMDSFDRVLEPKVFGALALDEVTKDEPLDFFVLFSSIASIMPNQGQCDYAAANSFLDAFSHHRNTLEKEGRRSGMSLALNWPLWKDGGIGVIKEEEEHLWKVFGMKPLATDSGLFILSQFLQHDQCHTLDQLVAIDGVQRKIEKHLRVITSGAVDEGERVTSKEDLKGLLKRIVSSIHDAGRDINDNENLNDFGVDSVGLATMSSSLTSVMGINVEPTLFFDQNTINKISDHVWLQYGDGLTQAANKHQRDAFFPERGLIDVDLSDSANLRFMKYLSDREFFMKDHVVEGLYNVPGACYIEMALEAGELISDDTRVLKLTNNYWAKQLSTPGDAIQVDVQFQQKNGAYEYEISHQGESGKDVHALGQLHLCASDEQTRAEHINLDEIRKRCHTERFPEEIYQFIHAEGLHVGPSFMPMLTIVLSDQEALSHLKLPEFISNTFADYVLHPSMLTGVLQTALLNNKPNGLDDTRYIPLAIDEIEIRGKIPVECVVYTELVTANNSVSKFNAKIANLEGEVMVWVSGLSVKNLVDTDSQQGQNVKANAAVTTASESTIDVVQVNDFLKECMADTIGLPAAQIDADTPLESYGINSVMIVDLNRRLEKIFGNLSKTLLFEYQTIQELAGFFIASHSAVLQKHLNVSGESDTDNSTDVAASVLAPTVSTPTVSTPKGSIRTASIRTASIRTESTPAPTRVSSEQHFDTNDAFFIDTQEQSTDQGLTLAGDPPIAVVGMSGRYPGANNMAEFWKNLSDGKDCITQVPASRFDRKALQAQFGDENLLSEKWGGFIDDLDKFDPMFFNISPREAAMIDPQERVFLETVWETIEDAGYNYEKLKDRPIGVFVGALWQAYINLGVEHTSRGDLQRPSGLLYSIANRASFFFDWSGPSMAIDTACSSSLTALHLACESLKRGESESAIVGGVNISLSSSKYLWLSHNNFLSSDGRCRSFGDGGDGYVPGEGIGAVYLKRLHDAERDGDRIYGVIKGTSINHGGKTNGYTVPNPNKQGELISTALQRSGVSPENVSYVEAHGTGTSLGDPIEITGLKKAFAQYTDKKQFCAIGSVKSNIGHLEAAAGIAGLSKILLQMKHKTLVPSIHCDAINPNIDFSASPFVVQKDLQPWSLEHKADTSASRCAMLSSFGAGGSNAHAIIEEYQAPARQKPISDARLSSGSQVLVPVSAKNADRLMLSVKQLLQHVEHTLVSEHPETSTAALENLAYTLQIGRTPMDERVVFVVKSVSDLVGKLTAYTDTKAQNTSGIVCGNVSSGKQAAFLLGSDDNINRVFNTWILEGDANKIANLWINGVNVDWMLLYANDFPSKVSLPTYPFKRDRYWLRENTPTAQHMNTAAVSYLHELLHENTSDLYAQRFTSHFTGSETFFVSDGAGKKAMSQDAYKEMARQALMRAIGAVSGRNTENGKEYNDVHFSRVEYLSSFDSHRAATAPLHIEIFASQESSERLDNISFEIYSGEAEQPLAHMQGLANIGNTASHKHTVSEVALETVSQTPQKPQPAYDPVPQQNLVLTQDNAEAKDSHNDGEVEDKPSAIRLISLTHDFSLAGEQKENAEPAPVVGLVALKASPILETPQQESPMIKPSEPALRFDTETISSSRVNSGKSNYDLVEELSESLASALYMEISDINIDDLFTDMGLDSIVGVEWIKGINQQYHLNITATIVYDYPTIRQFAYYLEGKVNHRGAEGSSEENSSEQRRGEVPVTPQKLVSECLSVPENVIIKDALPQDILSEHTVLKAPALIEELSDSLAAALYMDKEDVDIDTLFTDMGLDSIVGVEWIKSINGKYSLNISATIVYDYPTIRKFSYFLESKLANRTIEKSPAFIPDTVSSVPVSPSPLPVQEQILDYVDETTVHQNTAQKNHTIESVHAYLKESLAAALYMDVDDVDTDMQFTDMGLDSIIAVEWIKLVNQELGCSVVATLVYDYPNIREFSTYLQRVFTQTTGELASEL